MPNNTKIANQLPNSIPIFSIVILVASPTSGEAGVYALPGGVDLTPNVSTKYLYDDNIARTSAEPKSSRIAFGQLDLDFEALYKTDRYAASYSVTRGEYLDSETDDFTDQALDISGSWEFSSRLNAELAGAVSDTHEARGTGYSQGVGDELTRPRRYRESSASAYVGYGFKDSPFRAELGWGARSLDYASREDRQRDREGQSVRLSGILAVGSNTDLIAEVVNAYNEYDLSASDDTTLDSEQADYLIGINWVSGKTTMGLRFGRREKRFDAVSRSDFSGARWQFDGSWSPVSYSTFELSTERGAMEPLGFGDLLDTTLNRVGWQHAWTDSASTKLAYSWEKRSVQGGQFSGLEEVRTLGEVGFSYQVNHWLAMTGGYEQSEQASFNLSREYTRNLMHIGFAISI